MLFNLVLSLNNLKLNKTTTVKNVCKYENLIHWLSFKSRLALTSFRTTWPINPHDSAIQ